MAKRAHSLRGRRATEAVPSVEEFLGLPRDPRAAFAAGHIGELRDVITAAKQSAHLSAERRAYTSQRIMLPNGSVDARVQPEDPVTLPAWAFETVCDTALNALEGGEAPKQGRGKRYWYRRYRAALIRWHRYVLVRRAIEAGSSLSPDKQANPTAFEVVSDKLKGTSFGASAKQMDDSYYEVVHDLERGEAWRYYRSRSFHLYENLLNPDADVVVSIAGIHGQSATS